MNCICCGKPLKTENDNGWHKACIKRFFGTANIPEIEIDEKTLESLAAQSTSKGLTVPGVQKKLSLHLSTDNHNPRLTLVNYPMKPKYIDMCNGSLLPDHLKDRFALLIEQRCRVLE